MKSLRGLLQVAAAVAAVASSIAHADWERGVAVEVSDVAGVTTIDLGALGIHRLSTAAVPSCIAQQHLHALALVRQGVFYRQSERPELLFTYDEPSDKYVEVGAFLVAKGLANAKGKAEVRCGRQSEAVPGDASYEHLWDQVSQETGVSKRLLYAIALRESGRGGRPYPWTINERGVSRFFVSKDDAVAYAKRLLARGEEWFDVGFMQLHWRAHKGKFDSVDSAFEPLTNIRAGATVLVSEYRATGSVVRAVARYHRGAADLDERGRAYVQGVTRNLRSLTTKAPQALTLR